MQLSDKEFKVLSDTEFLLTKVDVLAKIELLLVEVRNGLEFASRQSGFTFPFNANKPTGKISRGENYRNLPYMVLDYPAYFQKDNIFAFRTMFWWGNFFSCTLHLQGTFLNKYRDQLGKNIELMKAKNTFISVGISPWQYHYGSDNYAQINNSHEEHVLTADFIKLSWRLDLERWKELPDFAKECLDIISKVVKTSD